MALRDIYRPVTLHTLIAPGSGYIYATALSLIVGTALVGWLIKLITYRGLGNGFWLIYAALVVDGIPRSLSRSWEQLRVGAIDFKMLAIAAGFLLAAVAVLVIADFPWQYPKGKQTQAGSFGTSGTFAATIWPPLLAAYVSPYLLALVAPGLGTAVPVMWELAAINALEAVLILLFTGLSHARLHRLEPSQNGETKPVWITALAQIAVLAGAEAVMLNVPVPFYINANSIIIFVAVAVHFLRSAQADKAV